MILKEAGGIKSVHRLTPMSIRGMGNSLINILKSNFPSLELLIISINNYTRTL